jgi:hypothetical protein
MTLNVSMSDKAHLALPQFVKKEYPAFISFLKAYYENLNSKESTRKLENIRNIDESINSFVDLIKAEVSSLAPQLAENPKFLANAKEVYASRGSIESYNLLFRLLYQKNINIVEPGKKILKASDGRWIQENSFFATVIQGEPNKLVGKNITITTKILGIKHFIPVFITKVNKTKFESTVEVFFEKIYGTIKVGDVIEFEDNLLIVESTLSQIKILKSGFGFKVGQMFHVTDGQSSGVVVKVTKVGETGDILRVQFVGYSPGYSTKFNFNVVELAALKPSIVLDNGRIDVQDVLDNYADQGSIVNNDYSIEHSAGDYSGKLIGNFYSSGYSEEVLQDLAILQIDVGAINKYPGYYNSSVGLLSDDSYIFDGKYYNEFSYVIQIEEKLENFKKIVLEFLNPIGHKLFADYLIQNNIELFFEIVEPIIRIILPQYSNSDESFRLFDKLISGRHDLKFSGDNVTSTFSYPKSQNNVLIHVRIESKSFSSHLVNSTILESSDYSIDEDGNVTLNYIPEDWETIVIRYVDISYASLSSFQECFFDFVFGDILENPSKFTDAKVLDFYKNLVGPYGDTYKFNDAKAYWMEKVLNYDPNFTFC